MQVFHLKHTHTHTHSHTHTHTHMLLHFLTTGPLSFGLSLHARLYDDAAVFLFELVDWVPNELGALLFAFCDPVALSEQVIVDLVGHDAVLLVLRVLCDKVPHPLGHGHEFAYFRLAREGVRGQRLSCMQGNLASDKALFFFF